MPASGPVQEPKMFPAATMDDQEAIMEGRQEGTVLGAPPFSSPDPATDAIRMLPVEDGTSAHQASLDAESARDSADYNSQDAKSLKALAEERDLTVEGTGKNGNVTKADYIAALQADDASDMTAADFKDQIDAATSQEELDAVGELYDNSGKSYSSVESAFEKKQAELDEGDNQ